jgi:hypothetical protein
MKILPMILFLASSCGVDPESVNITLEADPIQSESTEELPEDSTKDAEESTEDTPNSSEDTSEDKSKPEKQKSFVASSSEPEDISEDGEDSPEDTEDIAEDAVESAENPIVLADAKSTTPKTWDGTKLTDCTTTLGAKEGEYTKICRDENSIVRWTASLTLVGCIGYSDCAQEVIRMFDPAGDMAYPSFPVYDRTLRYAAHLETIDTDNLLWVETKLRLRSKKLSSFDYPAKMYWHKDAPNTFQASYYDAADQETDAATWWANVAQFGDQPYTAHPRDNLVNQTEFNAECGKDAACWFQGMEADLMFNRDGSLD